MWGWFYSRSEVVDSGSWRSVLGPYIASINMLKPWKDGLWMRQKVEETHTFDLIKLFTYPHMPPGLFAGHMKDKGGLGKGERERGIERERALLRPGTRREKVQWHAGRKSASDQQGLANQSVRRAASCSFWLERKEPRSRWCSPVPAVLQRKQKINKKNKKKERRKKKKMTIKETHPRLMWGRYCITFGLCVPVFSLAWFLMFCLALLCINIPGTWEYL